MDAFRKFYSIENVYSDKTLEEFRSRVSEDEVWCVSEKVHGANFSFTTDGVTVKYAKRTSFLEPADLKQFYNCQNICDRITPKIVDIFNTLKLQIPTLETVTVYGELFGGGYSGIEKNPECKLVQKGVEYYHEHGFYAFDISITYDAQFKYLNYDEAVKLFERHNVFHAKIAFVGTLDECLIYSRATYEDLTDIPKALYGDDYKEILGNVREGNVIKPIIHHYMPSGSSVVLKDKNDKFKEKAGEKRLNLANLDVYKSVIKIAKLYITEVRLNNYISKNGPLTKENKGNYIGGLCHDAIEDFLKENPDKVETFKQMKQKVYKALSYKSRDLVTKMLNA
jgi:Rnl2 family RNA ligase